MFVSLHLGIKFAINLDGKIWHNVKRPNCLYYQCFNNKNKLHFITINYTHDYTLHHKIKFPSKLITNLMLEYKM